MSRIERPAGKVKLEQRGRSMYATETDGTAKRVVGRFGVHKKQVIRLNERSYK